MLGCWKTRSFAFSSETPGARCRRQPRDRRPQATPLIEIDAAGEPATDRTTRARRFLQTPNVGMERPPTVVLPQPLRQEDDASSHGGSPTKSLGHEPGTASPDRGVQHEDGDAANRHHDGDGKPAAVKVEIIENPPDLLPHAPAPGAYFVPPTPEPDPAIAMGAYASTGWAGGHFPSGGGAAAAPRHTARHPPATHPSPVCHTCPR